MQFRILLCVLIFFTNLCHATHQYELSICAIFKDEAPYLREWIEFHKLVGVQHFYLYNHRSQDNYLEILAPHIKKGEVTLRGVEPYHRFDDGVNYDFNSLQCHAYTDAAKALIGISKWVIFLDTDEFLFPTEQNNLVEFLKNYEDCSGIAVNWQMFGTSHIKRVPRNRLMIETLLCCAPEQYSINAHVKSIVKPECVAFFLNPHAPVYIEGYSQVNTDKKPFEGPYSPYIQINKLRINHYWSRDEYFFHKYKIPRRKKWKHPVEDLIRINNEINQETNSVILKYVPELRKRMARYNPLFLLRDNCKSI